MTEEKKSSVEKIADRLKEYRTEAKLDCQIDKVNLSTAFDNTSMVMKWIDRKVDWNRVCAEKEQKLLKVRRSLFEFYRKDYPLKLDSTAELNLFITSDDQYMAVESELAISEATKKFIGDTIDTLKARAWEVKGFAEYERFKNGLS